MPPHLVIPRAEGSFCALVAAPRHRTVVKAGICCHDFGRRVLMSVPLRCARLLIHQFQALAHMGESAAGPRLRFLLYPQLLAVPTFDLEAVEGEDDAEAVVEVLLSPRAPGPPLYSDAVRRLAGTSVEWPHWPP